MDIRQAFAYSVQNLCRSERSGCGNGEDRLAMKQFELAGVVFDVDVHGAGPPMLYLHPEHYGQLHTPFLNSLAESWTVYAPRHPGFDGRRPPANFRQVSDIAYLYLDLLECLDLDTVVVLGASFGGWVALEMAVRDRARLCALGLIAPLGVKLGGRDDRDFADLSALPDNEAAACLFAGPLPDLGTFSQEELIAVARDRQFLAYYGWKPYLHNPSLVRWLHRVKMPVHLMWGAADGFVAPSLGQGLADLLPDVQLDTLSGAGHYPQIECLDEMVAVLAAGPCASVGG